MHVRHSIRINHAIGICYGAATFNYNDINQMKLDFADSEPKTHNAINICMYVTH